MTGHDHDHHHHDHDHSELSRRTASRARDHPDRERLCRIRSRSMHLQAYETKIGPQMAPRFCQASSDPAFQAVLLDDATRAVSRLGHVPRRRSSRRPSRTRRSDTTWSCVRLCSSIPGKMLGLPPSGIRRHPTIPCRQDPRRARRLWRKPPKDTEIRVWDSTAETRFWSADATPKATDGWKANSSSPNS